MIYSEPAEFGVLEMFILALLNATSVDSLYRMRREAALEPGGIKAALQHLHKAELISRSEPAKRRRKSFSVTASGHRTLSSSWSQCLRDHASAEAVLRAAMVGWWAAGSKLAAQYLESVGASRLAQAKSLQMDAALLERSKSDPLSAYGWMRVLSEAHRRRAEAEAFLAISQSLQESSN